MRMKSFFLSFFQNFQQIVFFLQGFSSLIGFVKRKTVFLEGVNCVCENGPKTEKPQQTAHLVQRRDNDMEEMNDCLRLGIMKNNINNLEYDMGQKGE